MNKDADKKTKTRNVTHQYVNRLILSSRLILYISFEIFGMVISKSKSKTRFIIFVHAGKM